ncbi:SspB family protein [Phenylobacterium sp.]|uniref:SspB family protein n=1 Tax=Phenylobacterium sp. TaxID=1871053 RepID=UPI0027311559|nr:ClpXP protease specificity-enhancing factor SspB [Phenylobacterium sp.]MDP1875396.1 ClpXP protease specificity-enhancing factor SspB [Phenylobacterium sp.]MDP3490133.1 ClpXP protease specificity-enhancing factor SspB [Phenylobacterium sp.]
MAQEPPAQDQMHYEAMAQEALRGVVKAALKRAASPEGLPGAHHFYVTFKTDAPGVSGPVDLLSKYPDEMTIVLQHQYWDLAPGETFFSVTLKFGGQPKRVSVPYAAVSRFYDPSVQFLLQFEAASDGPARVAAAVVGAGESASDTDPSDEPPGDPAEKVVSLDQFRKK